MTQHVSDDHLAALQAMVKRWQTVEEAGWDRLPSVVRHTADIGRRELPGLVEDLVAERELVRGYRRLVARYAALHAEQYDDGCDCDLCQWAERLAVGERHAETD